MKDNQFTKSLAILLNLTLVGTSFADVGVPGAAASAVAMPDFVKALTPPEQLGFVTDSYPGQTDKPVILIQDLHANYGVQKKIEAILKHLQPLVAQGERPMVMGIEAAWGDVDFTPIKKRAEKVRQVAGEFLLKEAEITGMDQFAIMSKSPVKVVGIDDPQDYVLHRNLVQKSMIARLQLAQKVERLRAAVASNRTDAPHALRRLWRIDDAFHEGKMDLPELSKKLGVPLLQNYGQAEAALAQRKAELADQSRDKQGVYLSNLVLADENLQLLSRLLRQQLTLEEVAYVSHHTQEMLVAIQSLLPGENMDMWKEAIHSAADYYAIALMRDKPLSEHARELAQNNPDTSVVVVTGGFHTAAISQYFKEKKVSYMVIAPAVESHTDYDEMLYVKRMMGIHLSKADMIQKGLPQMAAKSVQSLLGPSAAVEEVRPDITALNNDFQGARTEEVALDLTQAVGARELTVADVAASVASNALPETSPDGVDVTEIEAAARQGAPINSMPAEPVIRAQHAVAAAAHVVGIDMGAIHQEDAVPAPAQAPQTPGRLTQALTTARAHASKMLGVAKQSYAAFRNSRNPADLEKAVNAEAGCSTCMLNLEGGTVDGEVVTVGAINRAAGDMEKRLAGGMSRAVAVQTAANEVLQQIKATDAERPAVGEVTADEEIVNAGKAVEVIDEAATREHNPDVIAVARAVEAGIENVAREGPQPEASPAPVPTPDMTATILRDGADEGQVAGGHRVSLFARLGGTTKFVIENLQSVAKTGKTVAGAKREEQVEEQLTVMERLSA